MAIFLSPYASPPQYTETAPISSRAIHEVLPRYSVSSHGSFSSSSSHIGLFREKRLGLDRTPHYIIRAVSLTSKGRKRRSSIDLDSVFVNEDGIFGRRRYAGQAPLGASVRDVVLMDAGRVLRAQLRRNDGSWTEAMVDLDEHIFNIDGRLVAEA